MFAPVFDLTWIQGLLLALVLAQVTILSVTVYLHRCQAHRALDVHPALAHVFRCWLWLTTGMSTLQWVAVHRKHHAKCETEEDPHSPKVKGLATVLLRGVKLYRDATKDPATLARYGAGAPSDWLEHNVYIKRNSLGLTLTALLNLVLFGWFVGAIITVVMFLWIPVWAAGVINGLAHAKGYRNFSSPDESRNLVPWGVWIGGEELHNNHHAHPTSAKLSYQPWEVDIGWGAIQLLQALGLAKVKKAVQPPVLVAEVQPCTEGLLQTLVAHRLHVGRWFTQACAEMLRELKQQGALTASQARVLRGAFAKLTKGQELSAEERHLMEQHRILVAFARAWSQLQEVWTRKNVRAEDMRRALQSWFEQAEASGVDALRVLALRMQRVRHA